MSDQVLFRPLHALSTVRLHVAQGFPLTLNEAFDFDNKKAPLLFFLNEFLIYLNFTFNNRGLNRALPNRHTCGKNES